METLRRAIILWNCARFACAPGSFRAAIPGTDDAARRWLFGTRADLVAGGANDAAADRAVRMRAAGVPETELAAAARIGARILLPGEDDYPEDLVAHPYAPAPLYVRGGGIGRLGERPRIAIVGSRAASRERLGIAERLGREAAGARVPVVSGLAAGVDAAAHRGALAGGGLAIGVLGAGVDQVYPPATKREHDEVRERGVLLSPFPLGSPPMHWHFPMRNRIVAALARFVVVVAAGERSGSLSTAAAAAACGVEVGAIPGSPLDPLSAGANRLIRDGAHTILEPRDALDPVIGVGEPGAPRRGFADAAAEAALGLDDEDRRILRAVEFAPSTAEEVAFATGRPLPLVVERLIALELGGFLRCAPGRRFHRSR